MDVRKWLRDWLCGRKGDFCVTDAVFKSARTEVAVFWLGIF